MDLTWLTEPAKLINLMWGMEMTGEGRSACVCVCVGVLVVWVWGRGGGGHLAKEWGYVGLTTTCQTQTHIHCVQVYSVVVQESTYKNTLPVYGLTLIPVFFI